MTAYYFLGVPSPATIIGTLSFLFVLDVTAVALRFISRQRRKQGFQADDWLTIPALLVTMGMAINMFWAVHTKKLGYKINSLEDMSRGVPTRIHDYVSVTLAPAALSLIKLSCLCLYRRIFVVDKHNLLDRRNLLFAFTITVISLWGLGLTLSYLFVCKLSWHLVWAPPWEALDQCMDFMKLGHFFMYSDFLTDLLVLMIPVPFIWRLRLGWKKKGVITLVFLLGIFASICSLFRMLFMLWSFKVGFDPALDEGLMTTISDYWFTIEAHVGLLAACLPTLPGLFKGTNIANTFKTWWTTKTGSSSSDSKFHGVKRADSDDSVTFQNQHILLKD
ncbi:unnamed protein product [Periconia digitata]|uniref:Rhodopsin domain-containing protein n=1 Tax=Periconia digitata TaxID=1303443 RepID=A0A9W4U8Q9_9PLEO|nr:unnamed protein product [Periconia digitata]